MDWGRTKMMLILTFLILDFFLIVQFIEKQNAEQIETFTESPFEEQLEADEISLGELPQGPIKASYISVMPRQFTEEEMADLEGVDTIEYIRQDNKIQRLNITLEEPMEVGELSEFTPDKLQTFIVEEVIAGENYAFWGVNEELGTITYYQQYDGRQFFRSQSSMLQFTVNEENQIVEYDQTLLSDFESFNENNILPAIQAVWSMYGQGGVLTPGSNITKTELVYYPLIQLTESQVFTPTWHFVVNGEKDVYVNAFEGQIIKDVETE
ncbi:two-component system regulatory protein YycI [Bacillus fonticola]|uniref:two-component system regulatory protein YycI n=1 Tax=Bacillus fonticola TaxID=2728853 RepID=UPI0014751FC4|nr:two-component system regulatory protein YycI [Bacillus fonticola]